MYEVAYSKYLEEVVKILESDPKFTERLKGMPEADIKVCCSIDHIDDLDDHVFDKLHKAKLEEIERLREQIQKQIEVSYFNVTYVHFVEALCYRQCEFVVGSMVYNLLIDNICFILNQIAV
uniref:ING domain-containing protein n=1 Tax=Heterorhabditis bacteriophora TaxID=37862 RepID=A0A1I7WGI5_HETBA